MFEQQPDDLSQSCVPDGHDWQPWFHWTRVDKLTRVCARWNCTGREEINLAGVASDA